MRHLSPLPTRYHIYGNAQFRDSPSSRPSDFPLHTARTAPNSPESIYWLQRWEQGHLAAR